MASTGDVFSSHHCLGGTNLDEPDLAYLRGVYSDDYELWERAEAAAAGTAENPWMGVF